MRKSLLTAILLLCLACLLPAVRAEAAELHGCVFSAGEDGLYREGGRVVPGAAITLYQLDALDNETQLGRATSGADGFYGFTGLSAGRYRLRAVLPEGWQFALPREGGSVMLPGVGSESFSIVLNVRDGQVKMDAHIGATRSSTYIKAIAFEDTNQNGGRSTAEAFLRGVEIRLYYEYAGELVQIAAARTDQNGEAIFLHMTPGTYRVGATLPAPYIIGPLGEKTSLWYNCVPPSDSNEGMTGPVTAVKGDSLGIGVGAVSTGSLTGRLWWDENMNGKRDRGETGYAGATVRLDSAEAGVARSVATGSDGSYQFTGLLAGNYALTVELPEDAMFTLPGGDSLFSRGDTFHSWATVTVVDQQQAQVPDIGVMPVTALSVQLYSDINVNGRFDAEEPVFAGATLQVLNGDQVLATAQSDGTGIARVPVVRGGERDLRVILPEGQVLTVEGEQNDFFDLSATGDLTIPYTLPHGEETSLYAGVTQPASVRGMLFNDENLSGVLEENETGLAGFTVQAVNDRGEVAAVAVTDDAGDYSFRSLLPAPHTVRFLLQDAYVCTDYSDTGAAMENDVIAQNAEYGETAVLSLTPGQQVTGLSCGIFRSATVSGRVLNDTGIVHLPAEGGMPGVTVTLLDAQGMPVSDTTATVTDEEGSFYLKGALPGEYMLRFTLPEDAAYTDSALTGRELQSAPFSLRVADDMEYGTVYAIPTGSLRGIVYRDTGVNGAYDDGDPALAGITMTMENTDLGLSYEAVTGEDGGYDFPALRPGAYRLRMALPEGLCYAYDASSPIATQADAAADSPVEIGIGDHQQERNIAAAAPARLEGLVFFDLLNDGTHDSDDPGAQGVTLSFANVDSGLSYTVQTDAEGAFLLEAMVPGGYLMRATLPDDCIAADHNTAQLSEGYWTSTVRLTDGLSAGLYYPILRYAAVSGHVWSLDGSLNGVSGRRVNLYAADNASSLATATTDESGAFAFGQLKPGSYRLSCDLPDARYNFARPADAALHGGTPDIPVGYYGEFPVAMGAHMTACDIGIGAMGALGDTAWLDLNRNGLQEGDEPCLPGVVIRLYQYGELAAEAVTDNQGRYLVTDLYPGAYTVQVEVPQGLRPTVRRTDYPLAASVLQETDAAVAEAAGVIVPSAGRSLNCDFGFVLLQDGVYPANLYQLYSTDWSYGGQRKQ